ncbi:hypothetical protein [Collimonas sp. PA-H2]|uniref:hypothetical protein n=1 Tax=Collimonas sp. PA-H2 TaxID=1881062 RepID=UPI00117C2FE6|nr:hypothetical protein [Collimonas sp. PA-H2]
MLDWIGAHCEQFSLWNSYVGAERQPLFFGKNQDRLFNDLVATCSALQVPFSVVDEIGKMPDW